MTENLSFFQMIEQTTELMAELAKIINRFNSELSSDIPDETCQELTLMFANYLFQYMTPSPQISFGFGVEDE